MSLKPARTPRDKDGTPVVTLSASSEAAVSGTVTVAGERSHLIYDHWTAPVVVTSDSPVEVYSASGEYPTVVECIWQLDSNLVDFHLLVDDVLVASLDLAELDKDYKLGPANARGDTTFSVQQYFSKRWQFRPQEPVTAVSGISVQLQAHDVDITVERGIAVRKVVT